MKNDEIEREWCLQNPWYYLPHSLGVCMGVLPGEKESALLFTFLNSIVSVIISIISVIIKSDISKCSSFKLSKNIDKCIL